MATRDHYEKTLTCPKCKVSAIAKVSEADNPWSGADFQVDNLPTDFVTVGHSSFPQSQQYRHVPCGTVF